MFYEPAMNLLLLALDCIPAFTMDYSNEQSSHLQDGLGVRHATLLTLRAMGSVQQNKIWTQSDFKFLACAQWVGDWG
jgi:hypothetical protein